MVLLGLFRKEIRLNVSSASSIALHKMLDDFCFPQAEQKRNGENGTSSSSFYGGPMLYVVLMPFRIECVEESLKRMPEVLMAQRDFVFLKTPFARAGCAAAQCESCSTL
jgi:hypothetical protein